jgi:hypothetical protein
MSDDILFKIGFESHQDAKKSLEDLAKSVDKLQETLKKLRINDKRSFDEALDSQRKFAQEQKRQEREAATAAKRAQQEAEKADKERQRLLEKTAKEQAKLQRQQEQEAKRAAAEEKRISLERREMARLEAFEWAASYEEQISASKRARDEISRHKTSLLERGNDVAEGLGRLARGVVLLGLAEGESMQKVVQNLAIVQSAFDLVLGGGKVLKGLYGAYQSLQAIKALNVLATAAEAKAADIATNASIRTTEALLAELMTTRELARMKGVLAAANLSVAGTAAASAAGSAVSGAAGSAAGAAAGAAAGGLIANAKAMAVAFVAQLKALASTVAGFLTAPVLGLAAAGTAVIMAPFLLRLRAEKAAAEEAVKKTEAMQAELALKRREAEIKAGAQVQIQGLRNQLGDAEFERNVERAATPVDRLAIIQDERLKREQAFQNAKFEAERFMTEMKDGSLTMGSDPSGGGVRAVEALEAATARYNDTLGREKDAIKEVNEEHKRSVMEQIKGVEDVMRARQAERKEIESSFQSAKERFGMMNAADQAAALQALERARTMKAGTMDADMVSKLEQVGTDEATRLVRENRLASAGDRFDKIAGGETFSRMAALDKEQTASQAEVARLTGVSQTTVESRTKGPTIDVKSFPEIQVNMDMQEQQLFEKIFGMVQDANTQMIRRVEAKINAQAQKQIEDEQTQTRKVVEQSRSG